MKVRKFFNLPLLFPLDVILDATFSVSNLKLDADLDDLKKFIPVKMHKISTPLIL